MEMLNIGSAPTEEPCVQVLEGADYRRAQVIEVEAYRQLLALEYPEPEKGYFKSKKFQHDFGVYWEVVAMYDPTDEEATAWAFEAEEGVPNWNSEDLVYLNSQPAWVAAKKS